MSTYSECTSLGFRRIHSLIIRIVLLLSASLLCSFDPPQHDVVKVKISGAKCLEDSQRSHLTKHSDSEGKESEKAEEGC